jgi:hypothetical protein
MGAAQLALQRLGTRLRSVEAPEACMLYAAVLTSRAKLSHALEQEVWMRDE